MLNFVKLVVFWSNLAIDLSPSTISCDRHSYWSQQLTPPRKDLINNDIIWDAWLNVQIVKPIEVKADYICFLAYTRNSGFRDPESPQLSPNYFQNVQNSTILENT